MSGCHVPRYDEVKVFMEAFDDLKNVINQHTDNINSLLEHKNRQIDENRKVSRRMDEFDNDIRYLTKEKITLEKRIDKLSSHFSGDYQLVATKLTPHKCPLCNGLGTTYISEPITYGSNTPIGFYGSQKVCNGCEGKGIVWG